jgi:Ribonuclease G/E
MSEEILINVTPQETRVAVMQLGVVQDLHIERGSSLGIVSNVYLGKVKRVLPGMQSAFIEIGLERSAFLHVADIWENSHNLELAKPIEKVLFEGQTLLVQVIKEPLGSKGARLSTQLSIAGRLLVYLPQERRIGVSQRIESGEQREALRVRLQAVLPPDHQGGYIIRTVAEATDELDFAADVAYLDKLRRKLPVRHNCCIRNWISVCAYCVILSVRRPRACWSIRASRTKECRSLHRHIFRWLATSSSIILVCAPYSICITWKKRLSAPYPNALI